MTLPKQFSNVLSGKDAFSSHYWLEIEGVPNAFGSLSKDSTWFASRAAADQLSAIKAYFKGLPDSFDARIDIYAGMASSAQQVEFSIVDIEDTITLLAGARDTTNMVSLAANVTKSGTTLTYTGTASTTYYPTGGGVIHIGNEAIAYTSHNTILKQFTGCSRGRYRSRAQAWRVNSLISHKPYALFGRQVWYYQVLTATDGTSTPVDGDKLLRFSGTVENIHLDDRDPGTYIISCVSLEKELTRDVFRDLRTVRDTTNRGFVGTDLTKPGMRFPSQQGATASSDKIYGEDVSQVDADGTKHFEEASRYMFLVDSEIIMFTANTGSAPDNLQMTSRALMGTQVKEHSPGFTMQEIAWVARYMTSGAVEHIFTRFTADPAGVQRAQSDHPLIVLLCLMLSTGDGDNNDGGALNFDILPESWGLGIPYTRVDVDGIVELANQTPDLTLNGFWDKPTKFTDIVKEALAPFGLFAVSLLGDVFTVRRIQPPLPDETPRTLTGYQLINKAPPSWDGNLLGLVQEVEFYYNRDIERNRWNSHTVLVNVQGKLYAQGRGQRRKYELGHLYTKGPSAIPGKPPQGGTPNPELLLQERIDYFKQGFTTPPPIIDVRCTYFCIDIEPGDLVQLTTPLLPEVQSGTRGLTAQTMRVLSKRINEASKTVELTLQDTGYSFSDYGYIAPCAQVSSFDSAFTFFIEPNKFTDTYKNGVAQSDYFPINLNGNVVDWIQAAVDNALPVMVISRDFKTIITTALAIAWDSGSLLVELDTDISAHSVGCYFMFARNSADVVAYLRQNFMVSLSQDGAALLDTEAAFKYFT